MVGDLALEVTFDFRDGHLAATVTALGVCLSKWHADVDIWGHS